MPAVASARSASQPKELYPSPASLEIAHKVIRAARIPHIPDLIAELQTELVRPDPNLNRVSDLIKQDPALPGRLLRIVNSAAYGGSTRLDNIHQAVVRLGSVRVAQLVQAEAVGLLADDASPEVRQVWESILEEAKAAVAISRYVDNLDAEEAYLFGVMHDVGELLFTRIDPKLAATRDQAAHTPVSKIARERQQIGIDHATVGFLLARHWQLPDSFTLAVYHHHAMNCAYLEDRHARTLVATIKLANYLSTLHMHETELPEMTQYRIAAQRELMLSDATWHDLLEEAAAGFYW